MALFGKKDGDNSSENIEDIDAKILAAIEETDAEEEERKKARQQAEIDRVAKQTKEREQKEEGKKLGRRFFMVPKDTEVGENSIKVTGNLFGEGRVGDKVYIYRSNGQIVMSTVLSIASALEGQTLPEGEANAAKNAVVTIELGFNFNNIGFDSDKVIPPFSVVTNAHPPVVANTGIENPALLGLSLEYKNLGQDKEFNKVFVNHMVNAKFVLPVHASDRIGPNGKPAMQLITLNGKDATENRMLPIFTDAVALKHWKDIFSEENKPTVVVLTFQEMVKITAADKLDFVVNAFGPVAVKIPFDFINKMVNSESYIKRFGENGDRKQKYRKETVNDGSKIAVGAPPQIAEAKAVREAVKKYCSAVPAINTAGVLCKIKKGEQPGYLVIVDCPKELARDIFVGLNEAIKPLLNKIKTVEFSRYQETVFADQYFAQEPFDYVKNPNV